MVAIDYNEATKKIALSPVSAQSLDDEAKTQAQSTVELVNRLMTDLVAHNGEIPPAPDALSQNISVSASKLVENAMKLLTSGRRDEAVKVLSTALEMVMRRPLWESTIQVLKEVMSILATRCDAYIGLKEWANAYADVSLVMLMSPQDPMNHFRKGVILMSAGRRDEALEFLTTAQRMSPNDPAMSAVLKAVQEGKSSDMDLFKP